MVERTGAADPLRVLPLLWRTGAKAGRSGLTLDAVVAAGIDLADDVGIDQLSMRKIADRLGVGAMTLYVHVPGKAELIELMVDQVFAEVEYAATEPDPAGWRGALETIAEKNLELLSRHRWLTDVDTSRPPLGPGTIAKYDAELRPLDGTGLDDVEIDQALTLLLDHVHSSARHLFLAEEPPTSTADGEWWEQAGPVLAGLIGTEAYPYAARIGEAAGQQYGAAADPRRAYTFGVRTILAGIEALIADKATATP